MEELLKRLADCIESGKVDRESRYPPAMAGEDGARELTARALEEGVRAEDLLNRSLLVGMHRIGERFGRGEVYVPEILFSAKAMTAAMEFLKPYFDSGEAQYRGTAILGTVAGDLHDIGKNIVRMVLEGGGWRVIDLGVDASADAFLEALEEHPDGIVGMSALLTTTMVNMADAVSKIKERNAATRVYVGGAPVTEPFCVKIGADGYFPDPHGLVQHLSSVGEGPPSG